MTPRAVIGAAKEWALACRHLEELRASRPPADLCDLAEVRWRNVRIGRIRRAEKRVKKLAKELRAQVEAMVAPKDSCGHVALVECEAQDCKTFRPLITPLRTGGA